MAKFREMKEWWLANRLDPLPLYGQDIDAQAVVNAYNKGNPRGLSLGEVVLILAQEVECSVQYTHYGKPAHALDVAKALWIATGTYYYVHGMSVPVRDFTMRVHNEHRWWVVKS